MQIQDNCCICHSSMKLKPLVRLLDCRHMLHQACSTIVVADGRCPICRGEIRETEDVLRRTNARYALQDKVRIIEAAQRGDNWASLALSLGVKFKTASAWVNSTTTESRQRGGYKKKSLTEPEIDDVLQWVEENPSITLKKIASQVQERFLKSLCVQTISNYLEGRVISVKAVHHQPITMNSEQNKEKRRTFVNKLNTLIREGKQIVYIDETNFNLFCRRHRGRAKVGARAVLTLPASRGPNIHLIGAIAAFGVVSMTRQRGAFRLANARSWITTVLERWVELGYSLGDLVIVCDNAPCHAQLEDAVSAFPSPQKAAVLRLGPYSPMLNPIEHIWAKVKAHVKTAIGIPSTNGPGVVEQRLCYLEGLIDDAKAQITTGDCCRAVQHSSTFFEEALAMEDMRVGS